MKNGITSEYYAEVARRLKRVINEKGLSEGDVVRLCRGSGFTITQSAVSKMTSVENAGKYSITLINCVQVCKALGVPMEAILDHTRQGADLFDGLKSAQGRSARRPSLVYNTDEDEFKGYLGRYVTYFFPTISGEEGLLQGELFFERSLSGEYCAARYKLDTNKKDKKNEPIYKHYEGELVVSVRMSACYCCLYNHQIGEICFFVFHHMYLNNQDICCRLATAVTVSAGDNRRPAMHRILLSRRELSREELSVLQSQLLLNSTDILISAARYGELCREGLLPEEMRDPQGFIRILPKEEYYAVSEAHIRALPISRAEKVEALCALRGKSVSSKYNKIGSKCDELIFEYLCRRENPGDRGADEAEEAREERPPESP